MDHKSTFAASSEAMQQAASTVATSAPPQFLREIQCRLLYLTAVGASFDEAVRDLQDLIDRRRRESTVSAIDVVLTGRLDLSGGLNPTREKLHTALGALRQAGVHIQCLSVSSAGIGDAFVDSITEDMARAGIKVSFLPTP